MKLEDVKIGMKVRFDRDEVRSSGVVVKLKTSVEGDCLVRVTGKNQKKCTEGYEYEEDYKGLPTDGYYWYVAPREMREVKPRAKRAKLDLKALDLKATFASVFNPVMRKCDTFKVGDRVEYVNGTVWVENKGDIPRILGRGIVTDINSSDCGAHGDLKIIDESDGKSVFVDFDGDGDVRLLVEEPAVVLSESVPDPLPIPGADPKAKFGATKPNLALNPGVAAAHQALAQEDGAMKYGAYNWRRNKVEMMTYLAAAKRHLDAFIDGQDITTDTKVSNLGAVMACCAIVLDASHYGTAIDNRPKVPGVEGCVSVQESLQDFKKFNWPDRKVDYSAWVTHSAWVTP